jgi:hypothetical protein
MGGTKDQDWKRDGHAVTFRFTSSEYRAGFMAEVRRLLPDALWSKIRESDDDRAYPQT